MHDLNTFAVDLLFTSMVLSMDAGHSFFQKDPIDLEQAVAENHRQLFSLNAVCMGGSVFNGEGIEWTYINNAQASAVMFPSLTKQNASTELNNMMQQFREQPPSGAGYWSLAPSSPDDVGLMLLARGWQLGWEPCWMVMDTSIKSVDHSLPENIRIVPDNTTSVINVKDLPYAEDSAYMSSSLLQQYPERAQRLIAFSGDKIIGHCCLFFSTGKTAVAGMYCVGVLPEQRRRGIGKALVLAACAFAMQKKYRYVVLNANHQGKPVYEQAGFEFVSYGITWWLMGNRYITHAPTLAQIDLAEAIGTGDITALHNLSAEINSEIMNEGMCNGMRWIELAVHYKQPGAVEWLVKHGATCTALDAWNLGWKERVTDLLNTDPDEVNRRYFDWGATLLHIAAERNDTGLLQVALNADPDLSLKDHQHNATALDWAQFFGRTEQIRLLKQALNSGSQDLPGQ